LFETETKYFVFSDKGQQILLEEFEDININLSTNPVFSGTAQVIKDRNWFMKFVRFCFKGEKLEVPAEGFVNLKLLKPVKVDLTNGWILE